MVLQIQLEYSDFGGTTLDGQLYIASARKESGKKYGWNEEPFLDIYSSNKNNDGSYTTPAAACELGKSLEFPIYKFVKEALVRKFGADLLQLLKVNLRSQYS